jgi:hypothetical protein
MLEFYPNPVSDILRVRLKIGDADAALSIYNLSGKLVKCVLVKNSETTIDLKHLDNGAYIAVIRTGSGVKQYKLIKQ